MNKTTEELSSMRLKNVLESHIINSFYGLNPTNMNIVTQRQERRRGVKSLTQSELETLKEATDILYNHADYGTDTVFDSAFCELYKALKRYYKLEKRNESWQNG